jgi:hypothetical protein
MEDTKHSEPSGLLNIIANMHRNTVVKIPCITQFNSETGSLASRFSSDVVNFKQVEVVFETQLLLLQQLEILSKYTLSVKCKRFQEAESLQFSAKLSALPIVSYESQHLLINVMYPYDFCHPYDACVEVTTSWPPMDHASHDPPKTIKSPIKTISLVTLQTWLDIMSDDRRQMMGSIAEYHSNLKMGPHFLQLNEQHCGVIDQQLTPNSEHKFVMSHLHDNWVPCQLLFQAIVGGSSPPLDGIEISLGSFFRCDLGLLRKYQMVKSYDDLVIVDLPIQFMIMQKFTSKPIELVITGCPADHVSVSTYLSQYPSEPSSYYSRTIGIESTEKFSHQNDLLHNVLPLKLPFNETTKGFLIQVPVDEIETVKLDLNGHTHFELDRILLRTFGQRIADDLIYIPLNNYDESCRQLTFRNVKCNDPHSMYFHGLDLGRIDFMTMTLTFRHAPSRVTIYSRCVIDVGYTPTDVINRYQWK